MVTESEAEELFNGLIELLQEPEWQGRLSPIVGEVRSAIARGKPAAGRVTVQGTRKREVVRRVEPLNAIEQLEALVSALEFALVTPVDLAAAAMSGLQTEDGGEIFSLAFSRDSAEGATSERQQTQARPTPPDQADVVIITVDEVGLAHAAVEPLRLALRAIRSELVS